MKKSFISFDRYSRIEKVLLLVFGVGIFFSLIGVFWSFFEKNSEITTTYGGAYTEGVVANASDLILNPVFVYGQRDQSVEADITNLVFSGLMRFNSKTGEIEDYMASHTLSPDKKTYTFRLKEGLLWHDGKEISADDVIFTYKTVISDKNFPNESLRRAFETVEIQKLNDMEVSFTLQYPYKFFLTNFTVGIIPMHVLEGVPVDEMKYGDFSSQPIGGGMFSFESMDEIRPNVFQVTLNAFRSSSLGDPKLESIKFMIYPSKNSLSLDSHNLDGIRPFPKKTEKTYFIDGDLASKEFSLPQYSALFFNMDRDVFSGKSGKKIRTGIQLGTNKDALLDIVPGIRIDTPLLEIQSDDWEFQYSPEKASGAFKDAGYWIPSKKPKTFVPNESEEKWITKPTLESQWTEEKDGVEISGIFPSKARSLKVFWKQDKKVKEIFVHKKQNIREENEAWALPVSSEISHTDMAGELRVVFYNILGKKIKEDALSLYWEKPENSQESKKQEENSPPNPDKDLKGKENEKKPFDSDEKNATNTAEIRETLDGKPLRITLLTSTQPEYYAEVAEYLKEDYKKMGLDLEVKALPLQEFYDAVSHREYDILLYGQNLGYNLDIYEFFHGSQVGKDNLSEYNSQNANVLIQEIRSSHVVEIREKKLKELQNILKRDIPAVFLFSPAYEFYYTPRIQGMEIAHIAFLRDRFSNADEWYIKNTRSFVDEKSWIDFPSWFTQNFILFITFSL